MTSGQEPKSVQISNIPVTLHAIEQPALYANHVSVTSSGANIQLEFSQILAPTIESDKHLDQLKREGVSGHLLCRLLLPEEVFRSFVLGMADQINALEDE